MAGNATVQRAIREGYITGVHTDKLWPRLEIDEFALDKEVLNLFLMALTDIQGRHYEDPWSWFQIAGIHGQPYSSWDDVGPKPTEDNRAGRQSGYCSHSSVTFPTWHRPYVAMMEQNIYTEMVRIANQYSDEELKKTYLEACSRFRFPYWDPCIPRQALSRRSDGQQSRLEFGVPLLVSSSEIYLREPHNPAVLTRRPNPLHQFSFPEDYQYDTNKDSFWDHESGNVLFDNTALNGTAHTIRAPDSAGQTDDTYINQYLSSHIQSDVGSSLYKVLTVQQPWTGFSNDVFDQAEADSAKRNGQQYVDHTVEGFHDNVHVFLGQGRLPQGSGHIGWPQYAAFDPIFWLHHCNVDRITALWQAKRSKKDATSWWVETQSVESNWAVKQGTLQKPSDYLVPFRNAPRNPGQETCWSSEGIRNWKALGYTYFGKYVKRNESSGENELHTFPIDLENTPQTDLNAYFNQFYGWLDAPTKATYPDLIRQFYPIDLSQVEALTGKPGPGRPQQIPSHASRIADHPLPDPTKPDYSSIPASCIENGKLRQWDIHILAEKFKFNGSYQVFVFLGPFNSSDPDHWPVEPNLVGINGVFSNNALSGNCSNCEQQAEAKVMVMEVVPLTRHLVKWIQSREKCPSDDEDGVCLENLSREQVSRFLAKNFHWRVADMNGCVYQGHIDFVQVEAVDRLVKLPERYEDEVLFNVREDDEPASKERHREAESQRDSQCVEGSAEQTPGYGDAPKEQAYQQPATQGGGASADDESRKCCGIRCSLM